MKKIAIAVFIALGAAGCNEMKGTITAHEALSLYDKDGKTISVARGTYSSELEAKDKTTIKVEIENAGPKGKDLKFNFTLPKNTLKTGEFDIPASQTGQPYGVRGERNITVTESDMYRGYESCTYEDWEQVCWGDRDGRVVCQTRRVTRWGQRYIAYRDVTETEELTLDLINSNDTAAAHFDGARSETYRDVYQEGFCR